MVSNDEKEICLRVYRDMQFMLEIIHGCSEQADSFTSEMLFQRIALERNAYNVEQERDRIARAEEMMQIERARITDGDD